MRCCKVDTPTGPVWHRYNGDGYGEHDDGSAYDGTGRGRAWPLLTGERGHYELCAGRDPLPYLEAMARMASPGGMLPEQVWDAAPIPAAACCPGRPTGSAMPLVWAHAEFLKLAMAAASGTRSTVRKRCGSAIAAGAPSRRTPCGRRVSRWASSTPGRRCACACRRQHGCASGSMAGSASPKSPPTTPAWACSSPKFPAPRCGAAKAYSSPSTGPLHRAGRVATMKRRSADPVARPRAAPLS